jgi:phospholipid N-methyltransferase
VFLRQFLSDPVTIGAIAPSGAQLAARMVDSAAIAPGHVVAELGAGTGPMTEELLRRHPDNPLVVLEPMAELAATLRARFPAAHVVEAFAQDLPTICADWGHHPVDRVVSSLPWAIWSQELQTEILTGVLDAMAPDGRMVTFTYWHAQPLPAARRFKQFLEEHFQTVTRSGIAWRNLPPAFVFVCDR